MPQYLRRRTKYVHVVFVDSTSLRTVSRYISLNQFTVFHPEEKYLDMNWPLSLISDVVLFKFSPVKNINSSEILFLVPYSRIYRPKFFATIMSLQSFSLKSFQNSLNLFFIINKLKLWKMIVGS